ncbi:DNA kinase/phosphatase Pnk1 [Microbotryomycetes sp. JL201]|nr:DNA kinase/phosphatase Pnk1 [Microbotryomycetes sp. JL201]
MCAGQARASTPSLAASSSRASTAASSTTLPAKRTATPSSSTQPAKKLAPVFAMAAAGSSNRSTDPITVTKLGKNQTCYQAKWEPDLWRMKRKVLALDIDGTLITTASGGKWPKDETDFRWLYSNVPRRLKEAHEQGYSIIFVSNQAGQPAHQRKFFKKVPLIGYKLGNGIPFQCYAALGYDHFRKPSTGMWEAFLDSNGGEQAVDVAESVYVGDAAGRPHRGQSRTRDHADTDRKFALNVGLKFMTPEEFFLDEAVDPEWQLEGWDPRTHDHSKPLFSPTNVPLVSPLPEFGQPQPEVVLFVGSPASGKTTLFKKFFEPAGYAHVNQDTLKTRAKCITVVRELLSSNKSCVVDNTSPARSTRAEYLDMIRNEFPQAKARIVYFAVPTPVAMHNNVYRSSDPASNRDMLPTIAFSSYEKAFEMPNAEAEGFDGMHTVNFKFDGDEEALKKWSRWLDVYPKGRSK